MGPRGGGNIILERFKKASSVRPIAAKVWATWSPEVGSARPTLYLGSPLELSPQRHAEGLFAVQIVFRFSVCPNRRAFCFDPFNLIDLGALLAVWVPEVGYLWGVVCFRA